MLGSVRFSSHLYFSLWRRGPLVLPIVQVIFLQYDSSRSIRLDLSFRAVFLPPRKQDIAETCPSMLMAFCSSNTRCWACLHFTQIRAVVADPTRAPLSLRATLHDAHTVGLQLPASI
jgi:hypothetical protein